MIISRTAPRLKAEFEKYRTTAPMWLKFLDYLSLSWGMLHQCEVLFVDPEMYYICEGQDGGAPYWVGSLKTSSLNRLTLPPNRGQYVRKLKHAFLLIAADRVARNGGHLPVHQNPPIFMP